MPRALAIILVLLFSVQDCVALECIPGKEERVTACDQLSVNVQWDETSMNDCTYNPPPGWVIIDNSVSINSESNGSHSVSVIAGGSNFATEGSFDRAYDFVEQFSGSYVDSAGQKKDFSEQLKRDRHSHQSSIRRFSATNNTLYATVSASGSGDFFDRRRGWSTITVYARLRCLGDPNLGKLTVSLFKEVGVDPSDAIAVENACKYPLYVATFDPKSQKHDHWFVFKPGAKDILADDDLHPIRLREAKIFIFAQTFTGDAGGTTWDDSFWSANQGVPISQDMRDFAINKNAHYIEQSLQHNVAGFYELRFSDAKCRLDPKDFVGPPPL